MTRREQLRAITHAINLIRIARAIADQAEAAIDLITDDILAGDEATALLNDTELGVGRSLTPRQIAQRVQRNVLQRQQEKQGAAGTLHKTAKGKGDSNHAD